MEIQLTRTGKRDMPSSRRKQALTSFRRAIGYLVVAGVAMVAAALIYLASYGPLSATLVTVVIFGVFVSVVLGGGLMAAGFFSADSGHDDDVAESTRQSFHDR